MPSALEEFKTAITDDDVAAAIAALEDAEARDEIDNGIFPYGRLPLIEARGPEMVDALLDAGADIDKASEFWGPGFWVDGMVPEVAAYLIAKGAGPTVHSAAAAGLTDVLGGLLDADPALLEAPGGDGGTPLHFARTVEVAELLIDRGANLNPRDDDHDSTPAQWRVKASPDVTRVLLDRGAEPDVFLAAALGDIDLARAVVASDPDCVTHRIGNNEGPTPGIGFEGAGGTILQWTVGFNLAPQEVAMKAGHVDVYEFLMQTTPPKHKLQIACMLADRELATSLLESHPTLVDEFTDEDRMLLAKACWETNNETEAIRLMVDCGFPLGVPEHNHAYSPLHNASWSGNAEVVRILLEHGHPVDMIDPAYGSSATGYAIHSAVEARKYPDVDYGGVIDALVGAGLDDCLSEYPVGHEAIDAVMKRHIDAR
ncbi:MAG: ankyrin repeat domain-containing protein [Candidatus Poribacteria bacterium]